MEYDKLEEELFAAALSLPANERENYLARACEDSPSLQARLKSLIRVVDSTISYEESPVHGSSRSYRRSDRQLSTAARDRRRRLRRRLSGRAEGAGATRRSRSRSSSSAWTARQVIARFEAERQALALMDHPNIAKVFDAGATESGRPYFVMELVRGMTITDYCDRAPLDDRGAAGAVHAGVPGDPARASEGHHPSRHQAVERAGHAARRRAGAEGDRLRHRQGDAGRLTEETLFTAMEQFVGTPAYMSPEQAEPGGAATSTRAATSTAWVCLLYELLTGMPAVRRRPGRH